MSAFERVGKSFGLFAQGDANEKRKAPRQNRDVVGGEKVVAVYAENREEVVLIKLRRQINPQEIFKTQVSALYVIGEEEKRKADCRCGYEGQLLKLRFEKAENYIHQRQQVQNSEPNHLFPHEKPHHKAD